MRLKSQRSLPASILAMSITQLHSHRTLSVAWLDKRVINWTNVGLFGHVSQYSHKWKETDNLTLSLSAMKADGIKRLIKHNHSECPWKCIKMIRDP